MVRTSNGSTGKRRSKFGWAVTIPVTAGVLLGAATIPDQGLWFRDITRSAGVAKKHQKRTFNNVYSSIMDGYSALGSAVAAGDYNGDGFEDLYVTSTAAGTKNHLYRNNGDLTFTDVAEEAGVAIGNDGHNASDDALWFDYDNDGRLDLLVVRMGYNMLFHNLGNGKFENVTKKAGVYRHMNAITAIAFDYDRDGYVDLLVGSYFQNIDIFKPSGPRFFPENFETANNGGGLTLFHNNHDGTFTDVTEKAGLKSSGWVLDVGHGDADNDGDDDLYVACDYGTDRFYVNNGDGTFTDRTESAVGIDTKKGMNVDWGDYDNDGLLDIYVTNITDEYMREGNFLWHNNGNLTFTDLSRETGTSDTGWGWAAKFFDYDNDGWLDLYVVNGWVSAGKESYLPDIFAMLIKPGVDYADARNWPPMGKKTMSGYEKKRLFHNQHGEIFKDEAPRQGMDSIRDGRGIAIADFDNDGRLDLFVSNVGTEPYLYHNVGPRNAHWSQFVLEGTKSNRSAVGAQVRLTAGGRTYLRFVNGGNGMASQSTMRVHFGLGESKEIGKVEIRWPSGPTQTLSGLSPDRIYKIVEGEPEAREFVAKARK